MPALPIVLALDIRLDWRVVGFSVVLAIVTGVLFGLVHCLIGIPLGAGLALTLLGLWLSQIYFDGGVELSTQAHTAYDLIVFGIVFGGLAFTKAVRWWRG